MLLRCTQVVKNDLSRDLSEYGIELVRLNFETPKVLDANIAKEMANQSLVTAQVNARESVLQQNFKIAQTEASQGAEVVRIKQEQDNQNVLTAARTQLEAAKLRADALVIEAEARKKVAELEGTQYASYPQLLQIKLAELQVQSLSKANMSLFVSVCARMALSDVQYGVLTLCVCVCGVRCSQRRCVLA